MAQSATEEERAPVPVRRRLAAEVAGTFIVTATAIGIDIFFYTQGNIDYASRWLARGLATAAVIYAFSETSGAHVDPAVTIGFLVRRVISIPMAAAYIVAQFAGAFAAAGIWLLLFPSNVLALGVSHPGLHMTPIDAFVAEIVATLVLMLTILMTAQEEAAVGKQAALAVGFMVAACGFVAGPISGASMNPARTIAPGTLAGSPHMWIYAAGPLIGAIIAVAIHGLISGPPSAGERKSARGADERG